MFVSEMKKIVNYSMKYDIVNMHSYDGYDNADILKITFKDLNCLMDVREFAKKHKIKTSTKLHSPKTIYIIIENPTDVYSLKK